MNVWGSCNAVIDELPLTGDRGRRLVGARPGDPGREADVRSASPGYFEVMHIPVVAGRSFEPTDSAAVITPRVVISQSLANQVFGSESAVGRQIWLVQQALMADVIGVVGDVKHRSLDELQWLPCRSSLQEPSNSSIVVVRSSGPAADVITVVREEVDRLDSKLPVPGTSDGGGRRRVSRTPGSPTADRGLHCIRAPCSGAQHDWTL